MVSTHAVVAGETLSALALRFYGGSPIPTSSMWGSG
ncbi:Uncharacterised protein [Mycobacterium tuberculosis]|nr:Uncharacterised protein [Mycobacterium tuberculosis]